MIGMLYWTVFVNPNLPITNNEARRLRHWVIARKISHGTRTPQGSRAYTLLASVIDTCRQRNILPWPYIRPGDRRASSRQLCSAHSPASRPEYSSNSHRGVNGYLLAFSAFYVYLQQVDEVYPVGFQQVRNCHRGDYP